MAELSKKTGEPVEPIERTVYLTDAEAMQKALEKEYRTDHLTLPNVAPTQDSKRAEVSDFERKIILGIDDNGEPMTDETVVDDKGTTRKEWRDQIERGIMPKDAPKEALDAIGKHSIDIVEDKDGQEKVVITSPSGQESVIAYPDTPEGPVPFGSELIHKTAPVPEVLDNTKVAEVGKEEVTAKPAFIPASNPSGEPVKPVGPKVDMFGEPKTENKNN
jgi:hypothetical protein